jgi:anthranilate phosphoribosyltransferase
VTPPPATIAEHKFAPFVRALGKGPNLSRPLTRDEARTAMSMIFAGEVDPVQLGAFLCLLRVKTETPEEVAGMAEACKATYTVAPDALQAHVDWASWAGKSRQLPLYLLAALALGHSGVRVFMHGAEDHTQGRLYTSHAMAALGLSPSRNQEEAVQSLDRLGFAYMNLACLSPPMQRIMDLKPLLGLRSPLHTVGRIANPSGAPFVMAAVTHPPYLALHQQASHLLGQPGMATFKGDGGEAERRPEKTCDVHYLDHDIMAAEEWPALVSGIRPHQEELDLTTLPGLWSSDQISPPALAAITGTIAIALRYSGRAASVEQAIIMADQVWNNRSRSL